MAFESSSQVPQEDVSQSHDEFMQEIFGVDDSSKQVAHDSDNDVGGVKRQERTPTKEQPRSKMQKHEPESVSVKNTKIGSSEEEDEDEEMEGEESGEQESDEEMN